MRPGQLLMTSSDFTLRDINNEGFSWNCGDHGWLELRPDIFSSVMHRHVEYNIISSSIMRFLIKTIRKYGDNYKEVQFRDLKHEELLPIWKGVAVYASMHHYNNPRIDST